MAQTVCHCRILCFYFQYYFQLSFIYFVILLLLGPFSAYNSTIISAHTEMFNETLYMKGTNINTIYAYLAMHFIYLFLI